MFLLDEYQVVRPGEMGTVEQIEWVGDDGLDVAVADSPEELEHVMAGHDSNGYTARIAAGYCWPWSDPRPDGTLVPDVEIDGWTRPWNLRGDRAVGGAPPAALWASDPPGFGQVDCIYTAHGFEYDHAGVIIGPDFVWRDGGGGPCVRRTGTLTSRTG